eukprot:2725802-Amphidinium_carterae.1
MPQSELLPVLVAKLTWKLHLKGADTIVFTDSNVVQAALVSRGVAVQPCCLPDYVPWGLAERVVASGA